MPLVCRSWRDALEDDGSWCVKLLHLFGIPIQYGGLIEKVATEFGHHHGFAIYFLYRSLSAVLRAGRLTNACGGYHRPHYFGVDAPYWHWGCSPLQQAGVYHGYCDLERSVVCLGAEFPGDGYTSWESYMSGGDPQTIAIIWAPSERDFVLSRELDVVPIFPVKKMSMSRGADCPCLVAGFKRRDEMGEADVKRAMLISIGNLLIAQGFYDPFRTPSGYLRHETFIPYTEFLVSVFDKDAIQSLSQFSMILRFEG